MKPTEIIIGVLMFFVFIGLSFVVPSKISNVPYIQDYFQFAFIGFGIMFLIFSGYEGLK
jgi:hypothetical protein